MGVLADQIQAVYDNPALSEKEKRTETSRIKAEALFDAIISGSTNQHNKFIGRVINFNGFTITIHSVGVSVDPNADKTLVLDITLAKGSENFRDTYYVRSPPILALGGSENLLQAMGEVVVSWWRGS